MYKIEDNEFNCQSTSETLLIVIGIMEKLCK